VSSADNYPKNQPGGVDNRVVGRAISARRNRSQIRQNDKPSLDREDGRETSVEYSWGIEARK
jgi:hypothetical protein